MPLPGASGSPPNPEVLALQQAVDLLVGSSGQAPSLKDLNALALTLQKGLKQTQDADTVKRRDFIDLAKHLGGLAFLVLFLGATLLLCPEGNRFDLMKLLLPVVTGALGLAFGQARGTRQRRED